MQGLYSIFLIGNIGAVRWSGDYFNPDPNPLIHLWSLAVEEQFYLFIPLVFAFLIFGVGRSRRSAEMIRRLYITYIIIIFVLSISLYYSPEINKLLGSIPWSGFSFAFSHSFSFYAPWRRAWEFALGSIIFVVSQKRGKNSPSMVATISATLLLGVILWPGKNLNQVAATTFVCFATAAAILFGIQYRGDFRFLNCVETLGNNSYSIYLIHLPVIYIFESGFFHGLASPRI